jgi:prophage regulatory protein
MHSTNLIRPKQAAVKAGISTSHLYALVSKKQFPQPIKISERITTFVESEIDEWIVSKMESSRSTGAQS